MVRGCGEPWPGSTRSESPGSGAGPPGRKQEKARASVERSAIAKVTGSGIPRLPGRETESGEDGSRALGLDPGGGASFAVAGVPPKQ